MGVVHRAYRFEPVLFHKYLQSNLMVGDRLSLEALRTLAVTTVDSANESTRQALNAIRFTPESLKASGDSPEAEQDFAEPRVRINHAGELYMAILCGNLSPVPSLSNRLQISWQVLEIGLPHLGWNINDVKSLIYGYPLHSLVKSSGIAQFASIFTGVDQFGGWLSYGATASLISKISKARSAIQATTQGLPSNLIELAELGSTDPRDMIRDAYADALEMLQTVLDKSQVLFLVLDY